MVHRHASNERLQHVSNGQPIDALLPAESDSDVLYHPSSLDSFSMAAPAEKQTQTAGPAAVLDQLNVEFKVRGNGRRETLATASAESFMRMC